MTHTYTCTYIYIYKLLFEKEQWQTMNSFEKWELETTKIVAHSPCCGHGFPIINAEISFVWELARRICYMKPSHIIYMFIVCSFFKSSARFCRCLWIPSSNQTWQCKTPRFWSENHGKSSSPLEKLSPIWPMTSLVSQAATSARSCGESSQVRCRAGDATGACNHWCRWWEFSPVYWPYFNGR